MRDVAIVAFSEGPVTFGSTSTPVEMIVPTVHDVLKQAGIERTDVDFWCHGSCDYMTGQPFSFVSAVDALGAWPPIIESHVEMDGAWALYEAWIKIQTGEAEVALVFGNGKSSAGDMNRALSLQQDPYTVAPLWPGMTAMEGLGACAALQAGTVTERQMAEAASRARRDGAKNGNVLVSGNESADELLSRPVTAAPFRDHDIPAMADGVSAVIIATGDVAKKIAKRPAWIRAIDHRIDHQNLGWRDLARSSNFSSTHCSCDPMQPASRQAAEHWSGTRSWLQVFRGSGTPPVPFFQVVQTAQSHMHNRVHVCSRTSSQCWRGTDGCKSLRSGRRRSDESHECPRRRKYRRTRTRGSRSRA
jgi:acetyl-CoA acetyltransferase